MCLHIEHLEGLQSSLLNEGDDGGEVGINVVVVVVVVVVYNDNDWNWSEDPFQEWKLKVIVDVLLWQYLT